MKIRSTILALLCAILTACSENTSGETAISPKNEMVYQGVNVMNGVICFENIDKYNYALNFLENEYENRENAFLDQYGHLTEEDLMLAEEQSGYNEYAVFEVFEKMFSFISLRKILYDQEVAWLSSLVNEPIAEEDPDNHFILEPSLRTILNQYCELKIGNKFYKYFEGGYIIVHDGDFSKLLALRDDINLALNMTNIEIVGTSPDELNSRSSPACSSSERYHYYESKGNYRIKCVVAITNRINGRFAIAKTINYKKNTNGNGYKKIRASTYSRVWGSASDYSVVITATDTEFVANCELPVEFNTENGESEYGHNKKEVTHKKRVPTPTKTDWIKGYHKSFFGNIFSSTDIEKNTTLTCIEKSTTLTWVSL